MILSVALLVATIFGAIPFTISIFAGMVYLAIPRKLRRKKAPRAGLHLCLLSLSVFIGYCLAVLAFTG